MKLICPTVLGNSPCGESLSAGGQEDLSYTFQVKMVLGKVTGYSWR